MADPTTAFVDDARHLICVPYTVDNLHRVAESLGIKRCWFHAHAKHPHHDVPKRMLERVKEQCVVISSREMAKLIQSVQSTTNCGKVDLMDTTKHTLGVLNTFTDSQLLGCVNDIVSHGGEVIMRPHDVLNPMVGFSVTLRLPAHYSPSGTKLKELLQPTDYRVDVGFTDIYGQHGGWEPKGNIVPNAIEALRDAVTKAQPAVWPHMKPEGHQANELVRK